MFTDSVFENLDDISKMIEPFQCDFNDELRKVPEEINLDYEMIKSLSAAGYWNIDSIRPQSIIRKLANQLEIDCSKFDTFNLCDFFKIQVTPNFADECYIDFDEGVLVGQVTLKKCRDGMSDKELLEKIIHNLKRKLRNATYRASECHKANINEIAEIFDITGMNRMRSMRNKRTLLIDGLLTQFKEQRINIRNYNLGIKFTDWLVSYIRHNNMAAVKNLCMFKILMLNGAPIYSLDNEEEL